MFLAMVVAATLGAACAATELVPYTPTVEQTSVFIVSDGPTTKAKVTMIFPDGGYSVPNWGTLQQEGNSFSVNAEVMHSTGLVAQVITAISHEYDLGPLAHGDYAFAFHVWQQHIETRSFRPGSEQWQAHVPNRAHMSMLHIMSDTGMKMRLTFQFGDSGHRVCNWGTPRQTGNTFYVNAEIERWTGPSCTVITTVSHDYDVGVPADGNGYFSVDVWQQHVDSREFNAGQAMMPVYRFWSPVLCRHFYTIDRAERDQLIDSYAYAWTYEGPVYYAYADAAEPDTCPVYRFWSGQLNSHFYTASESEKDSLIEQYPGVWTYEGVAFYAYGREGRPMGADMVFRLWSDQLGSHFFTLDQAEIDWLMESWPGVWTFEGTGWCAYGL